MQKKLFILMLVALGLTTAFLGYLSRVEAQATPTPTPSTLAPTAEPIVQTTQEVTETMVFVATVDDAKELESYTKENLSNQQQVTLLIDTKDQGEQKREAVLTFPNEQFKRPLKRGDQVLIESTKDLAAGSNISFVSYYRQNNLIIWTVILLGLYLVVSGFKNNLRYIQIFFIFLVSGGIVLLFYRNNTYLTFTLLFVWQILATYLFAYRIFAKRIPSIILTISVFISQITAMILAFVMTSINIFDMGLFDVFFSTVSDAREVMMYVFATMITYPIAVLIAEQVISESIKKKREDNDITKIDLMKYLSKSTLKLLNHIFITFFGIFFSILIGVLAIASNEGIMFEAANSSFLSQVLSIGFLLLFNLSIFIPLVSAITGLILGRFETHELVTDRNLKQLEL